MKNYSNFRQAKAIEESNKKHLLAVNADLTEDSGIYFLTRTDECGINYAYVGQAKHILTRLAQHLSLYNQHIDKSLHSHGLYSVKNLYGWKVSFVCCNESELDDLEQRYIESYANGYQLLNKKLGGQCQGNTQIAEYKPAKGYRDGLAQGYRNASRDVANLFDKHLNYSKKSDKPNKNQDKAVQKFETFLDAYKDSKAVE